MASPGNDPVRADVLFRQARQLMKQGRVAEACPKFAESLQLDPATGTLLNLASCHEAEGKLATASAEFQEALKRSEAEKRADRMAFAKKRLAILERRIPRLTLVVDPVRPADLEIHLDGKVVDASDWGVAVPIDPGAHDVQARVGGQQVWANQIEIPKRTNPGVVVVTVPVPVPKTAAPEVTIAPQPAPSRQATVTADHAAHKDLVMTRSTGMPMRKKLAIGAAGVSAVALGATAIFGWQAREHWAKRNQLCPTGKSCSDQAVNEGKQASKNAMGANIAFGAALASMAFSAYAYLTSPSPIVSTETTLHSIAPLVGPIAKGIQASFVF